MNELTKGGINFGYESPVKIIMGQAEQEIKQIQNETENKIMAEIQQQLGVYVDKEELIKALQYDRNQYDKGYSDGRASSIVEELESLKAKIDNPKTCMFAGTYEADWIMENIIDKRIAELKGE